jgi:Flp pilus assembly protein TadD
MAGCQHFGTPSARMVNKTPLEEPTPRITARQTADVQVALGQTLEKAGDTEKAVAAYLQAEKSDSKRPDAYWRLAVLYDRQGKFAESARQYRRAFELGPPNAELYCDLGYSMYLQRCWAEAEGNLQQAISMNSDLARAHNNLALVLARTDRPDEALRQFALGGANPADAHVNLALTLALDGHFDEARQHYRQALAANPSSTGARDGLRQLDRLMAHKQTVAPTQLAAVSQDPVTLAAAPPSPGDSVLARTLVRFQSADR